MGRTYLKIIILFTALTILSIQGLTDLNHSEQIQLSQSQFNKYDSNRNLKFDPEFGKIPLYFIQNKGQVDAQALFYAKTSKYTLWLTKQGLIFDRIEKAQVPSQPQVRSFKKLQKTKHSADLNC